jgi:hypothetical protein
MFYQLLIPVVAFAATATAASAFAGTDLLSKLDVDLTEAQQSALEEAHTIREEAFKEAKTVLENAGIDAAKMREIHEAMHEARQEHREAVKAAIEANDYDAFVAATAEGPMGDTVDTQAEFEKLVEAHNLMKSGDREGAKQIMEELGFPTPDGEGFGGRHGGMKEGRF